MRRTLLWPVSVAASLLCVSCTGGRSGSTGQEFPGAQVPANAGRVATSTATPTPPNGNTPAPGAIVTPTQARSGRVTLVNASARYVIVTYSLGQVPAARSRLTAYRDGLKVAELVVSDLSRDINIVADIVAGECKAGDEIREH